ncbi:IPT/TIG domain-containing protein [Streptomyces sp. NBC_01728]|uniref:IPT/TIG domain-containing protein n=1 Tax=unclassified Streptomyces TaxID=2593676 RepID=UPI0022550AD8|nr:MULTISPECIES: IPT/TIG domain-containing protein [unclassified Streptomyces]MCX4452334.1 IPT/TIG domain-containing protein [Streptomyces sp. NBC_01719]MCX4491694.1 IPT/TIG domain-containing protein [Streptomyces sp. NBC_01728]
MATLTSLSETQGKAGDSLVITGTSLGALSSTVKVNFATSTVTMTVSGTVTTANTTVTCTIPTLPAAGQYNVSVTLSSSTTNNLPFFYVSVPVCSLLSVTTGPVTPSSNTTITGTGLAAVGTTGVKFGANTATIVSRSGDTQITCTPPADTSGFTTDIETVNVTVVSPGGTSTSTGPATQFAYYNAPTVTNVSPGSGTASEDGAVVTGTGFVDVSAVIFRDTVSPNATFTATVTSVDSDTELVITTPAGLVAAKTYDVTVTTPGGQSALNPPGDQFTT